MSAKDDRRRALELLWNGDRRPARGPQRGLTLERIVEAALEVVRAEGLDALSMRRVATHLGVGTASLYTYVPGKAELVALMVDALVGGDVLPHERPGDWRAKLEQWARSDWAEFRAHPWALSLAAATPAPGPNTLRWLDSALLVLDGTGLTEPEKVAVVESVDAYVRGLARLHLEGEQGAEQVRERDEELGRLVDFSRYPALGRALAGGAAPYTTDQFEFGLRLLLDGVAALIAERRGPAPAG
ncbi:TetR/AcrR family transcriptional regulator [Saccharothrix coeruleofusca]|uniref:TetR family transcriptional regulator n=1 Tax=Saccharothrix coeruleofusca TaxID=33919 RepID=A0A918ANP2_9PSEU|nr:TetR/AcrR family transcriptional regulator [Saccharothrix coeruleofusca]MBP2337795.1 AcrR family transcriptional regulator [Saccharothrix coeruleofusca]GGP62326.1 TetR family transcriptional regulator [Saccharothrix coeruleofusca]